MRLATLLCMILFMSLQFGCSTERDATMEAARESPLTDSDLENQINAKFAADTELAAANLSVDADAEDNRATLSGTVESEELRTKAVRLAESAHQGLIIEDTIDVRPREIARSEYTPEMARQERERAVQNKETVGDSLDDAWIHSKVVAKLIADMNVPERKINVDVNNNTVTLRGTVDTAEQKAEAERIAKDTEGVRRVMNQLKVQPSAS